MPRAKAKGPSVRSDGEATMGNVTPFGVGGQPNGRQPRSPLAQASAAGAGGRSPYGEQQGLRQAIAQTPVPPGISPVAHAAHIAAQHAGLYNAQGQFAHPNVTPLSAPTERPWEPVTAGAPMDAGPTNPMAAAGMMGSPDVSAATILSQAADASGSQTLRSLAQRAQATLGSAPGMVP